jgi:hypothetical protein
MMFYRDKKGRTRSDDRLRWNDPDLMVRNGGRFYTAEQIHREAREALAIFDEHVAWAKLTGINMGLADRHYSLDPTYKTICKKEEEI